MSHFLRHALKSTPLWITGALWPLVLLAPFVPGLPRPEPSGLPWRQELLLSLLLTATTGLLLKSALGKSATVISLPRAQTFKLSRRELLLILPLALFVLWSAAALVWASNPYPILHYAFVWGSYLLFFLLMRRVATRPRLLALSLAAFVTVILIISLASVIGAMGAPVSLFRYNGLGEPLAISIPLSVVLALSVRRRLLATACGATALLAWLAMLQAFERTPFISTSAGLILLALLILFFPQFGLRKLNRACLMLGCFILVTAFQFMPGTFSIGAEPPHTALSRLQTSSVEDENTQSRLLFWGVALRMWREHPLKGVGANHYGIDFPEARAQFAASHPDSKLVGMIEGHLVIMAHNEYLQILAELGLVGLLLFAFFAAALVWAAWLALKHARSPVVPGAVCMLAIFAINSGASSISFRWLASGLIFFFAAALVTRFARRETDEHETESLKLSRAFVQRATVGALAFSLLMLCGMSLQGLNVTEHGLAQGATDSATVDNHYRSALFWNPFDGPTHFNYGIWLFNQRRYSEAIPHLRFGLLNGMNTSVCYAYLSSAQMKAGETERGTETLAEGLRVYPLSVFLRVRHASVLKKMGKDEEAQSELARAVSIEEAWARGWWELINSGKDATVAAAKAAPGRVAPPGNLSPRDAVFMVLSENGERGPSLVLTSDGKFVAREAE
ncbi:MAG: O-antigen ligase family protein [Pyrinomonadaceae bacterium]|nr:O-antigen ligase family protein [Pyrinomonadaceae bacterium]